MIVDDSDVIYQTEQESQCPLVVDKRTWYLLCGTGLCRYWKVYLGFRLFLVSLVAIIIAQLASPLSETDPLLRDLVVIGATLITWTMPNAFLVELRRRKSASAAGFASAASAAARSLGYRLFLSSLAAVATAVMLILIFLSIVAAPFLTDTILTCAADYPADPNAAIPLLIAFFYLKVAANLIEGGPILASFTDGAFQIYLAYALPAWICVAHLAINKQLERHWKIRWSLILLPGLLVPIPLIGAIYIWHNFAMIKQIRWIVAAAVLFAVRVAFPSLTANIVPREIRFCESIATSLFFFTLPLICIQRAAWQAFSSGTLSPKEKSPNERANTPTAITGVPFAVSRGLVYYNRT